MERLIAGVTIYAAGIAAALLLGQPAVAETTEEQRTVFQRALEFQKAGDLESAESAYMEVLALKRDSAATFNNLAKLYEGQGDNNKALAYFRRAVNVDDPNNAFYRYQYAEMLKKTGNDAEAARQFQRVALHQPDAIQAHREVMDYYLTDGQSDGVQIAEYLWGLLKSGNALRAAEAATQGLQLGDFDRSTRIELMTIVAAALGRPTVTEDQAKKVRAELRTVAEGYLEPCVEELERLYVTPAGEFPWWAEQGSPYDEPPRGIWRREAFRSIARNLGRRAELAQNSELAEVYYRTAATLHPEGLDPLAFEALVKLYARTEQIDRIEELANDRRYVRQLFRQKNEFYRRGQLKKIYDYHVTLGHIYGALAQRDPRWWGDSETPGSAVFQLERAVMVGEKVDAVDVGVVELLAGYYSVNQPGRDVKLRLDAAQHLTSTNRHAAASAIVKPLRNESLQPIDRTRLEMLELK
ncbi:MAG: hypothetical protein OEM60_06370 [Gammaproteobacteria bacterium]|nr:hypothetical protein [Gammaproteobacteria bacterium]